MLPINHLIKTLDRCCGEYEILSHSSSGMQFFQAKILQVATGEECVVTYGNTWESGGKLGDFLANRLNGLTRDDSGDPLPVVLGKSVDELCKEAFTSVEIIDGWQVWRNPPLNFELQVGDEYRMLDCQEAGWLRIGYSNLKVGMIFRCGCCVEIRRRIPQPSLPADFDCVPEPMEAPFRAGDWVVCVDARDHTPNFLQSGSAYCVRSVREGEYGDGELYIDGSDFYWKRSRFRHARPDEIPQAARCVDGQLCEHRNGACVGSLCMHFDELTTRTPADAPPTLQQVSIDNKTDSNRQLQLREGAWYERRDGKVVGPAMVFANEKYPWIAAANTYTDSGRFWGDSPSAALDLIREVPPPQPSDEHIREHSAKVANAIVSSLDELAEKLKSQSLPDSEGWIEWHGGEWCDDPDAWVDIRDSRGNKSPYALRASAVLWPTQKRTFAITHYRIVTPAPKQYRPFASAEEFRPFRDRWINCKDHSGVRVSGYTQNGVSVDGEFVSWSELFERFQFEDGTPCGAEVE